MGSACVTRLVASSHILTIVRVEVIALRGTRIVCIAVRSMLELTDDVLLVGSTS